jgi:hypothetical protein
MKAPAFRRSTDQTRIFFLTATLSSFTEEITMPDSDLLPSLLFKINENQLALEATTLELSNWVEQLSR